MLWWIFKNIRIKMQRTWAAKIPSYNRRINEHFTPTSRHSHHTPYTHATQTNYAEPSYVYTYICVYFCLSNRYTQFILFIHLYHKVLWVNDTGSVRRIELNKRLRFITQNISRKLQNLCSAKCSWWIANVLFTFFVYESVFVCFLGVCWINILLYLHWGARYLHHSFIYLF